MRTENASGAESACELDGSGRRRKKRFLGDYDGDDDYDFFLPLMVVAF